MPVIFVISLLIPIVTYELFLQISMDLVRTVVGFHFRLTVNLTQGLSNMNIYMISEQERSLVKVDFRLEKNQLNGLLLSVRWIFARHTSGSTLQHFICSSLAPSEVLY